MSDGPVRESDVYVSFCEEDDSPLVEGGQGRISLFCEALSQLAIDLDRELIFGRPGDGSPSDASLLLVVLSSAYVESLERMAEVKKFAKAAGGADAAAGRTFAIVLQPTDVGGALEWLKDAKTLDLFDASGSVTKAQLNMAASGLADEVAAALVDGGSASSETDRQVVFLAHADPGTSWAREHVRAELEAHGFAVVPRGPARWDSEDPNALARISDELRSELELSQLSVHVLGDQYHDGAALELGLAAERSAEGALTRLVWIAPDGDPADPRLKPLFDSVETAPRGTVHFRRTSIEAFATEVLDVLAGRKPAATQPVPAPSVGPDALRSALLAALREVAPEADVKLRGVSDDSLETALEGVLSQLGGVAPDPADPDAEKFVYLLYDPSDQKRVDRLKRLMQKRGFEVWSPLFSDDSAKNALQHRTYLENCDASLVVYGEAPGEWWHALQVQWKKLRYWRRSDERLPRGFYFTAPFTPEKLEVRGSEKRRLVVMRESERFSEESVQPFLELVRPSSPEA